MDDGTRRTLTRAGWFVVMALLGGGCDVSSKYWAEETLSEAPEQTVSVIDPWLELTLQYNEGTAFSVVRDLGTMRLVFGVFSLLIVGVLLFLAIRGRSTEAIALGLIAGGAVGNGVDRIFRDGVIDFIVVNYPGGGSWPTFNVADALVAVGVGVLLVMSFVNRKKPPDPSTEVAA